MRNTPFIEKLSDAEIRALGITVFGWIRTADIVFSMEVRALCAGNLCRNYKKTWACPPAVGSPEKCRADCLRYDRALVFSAVYPLEDSFDYDGMTAGHRRFKEVCDALYAHLAPPFLLLSNEGCRRCAACTYPDAPCRFPEMLFPSVEGYGILVSELAKSAGIRYTNGANTVTYFGMVCF